MKKERCCKIRPNCNGQIIILIGVVLAASVIVIASISAEMANLRTTIPQQRVSSLLEDFRELKQTFGKSLNYNLLDHLSVDSSPTSHVQPPWYSYYVGTIENITDAFNQTFEQFYTIEMVRGNIFSARLNDYFPTNEYGTEYAVEITLSLSDGLSCISENVTYSIKCNSYLTWAPNLT